MERTPGPPLCIQGDSAFELRRRSLVWQAIKPDRHPHAIWTAQSDSDIVEALYYARSEGRRVSIVAGGHSYIGHGLQDDAVLIDLSRMAGATVDREGGGGSIQPGVRVAALARELEHAGLAFPIGHEPGVGVVGFLLGGGLGWNPDHWGGMACRNVTAAEIVLASGERIVADDTSHADLFWAVKGAGPCFPAIVTRLHVRLFPRPAAIRKSVYGFPIGASATIAAWIARLRHALDDRIELSLTLLAGEARGEARCMVTAIAFADTDAEAMRLIEPIRMSIPVEALASREEHRERTFETLLRDTEGDPTLRHAVETVWTDDLEAVAREAARALRAAPSPMSLIDIAVRRNLPPAVELASSVMGSAFVFIDAAWHEESDDTRNQQWLDDALAALAPHEKGALINETDWNRRSDRLARCYSPAALARLKEIVARYDPTGLFINPLDLARC